MHLFAGQFESREEAVAYTEAQWEPEPDESVSDEEYDAWEARNPLWPLRRDLNTYLDSDFIETVFGADRYAYLESLLANRSEMTQILSDLDTRTNTLLLIFSQALGGFSAEMRSTDRLTYCGEYACLLEQP